MTLSHAIKLLQKLEKAGHGREHLCVDKDSLWDGNGCWTICDVRSIKPQRINVSDDDGGCLENKDGTERLRNVVIIFGEKP